MYHGHLHEAFTMTGTKPPPSFLEDLANPRPDPGGGAAAAYVALLALALSEKVTRLELGRCQLGDDRCAFWREQWEALQRLQGSFSRLCRDDVRAYQRLARTSGRGVESEQRQLAILGAIDCPHEMMRTVHLVLQTTFAIGHRCRKHLVGDVLVAVELLGAALQGAYHIASANLPLLREVDKRQVLGAELDRNRDEGLNQLTNVREELTTRLTEAASKQVHFDPCC
jgi:formiminotetrahydrofolate cyclodeaminase